MSGETVPIERFRELVKTNEKHYQEACTLRTRLQQVESERDQYKHEAEMWDEHMGPLTDYEGDEAPWQTMVREFENLRDQRDKAEADAANAGKSLLLRLQEAERLLSRAHPGMHTCETSQWFTDRDTFLNPKPQDVK